MLSTTTTALALTLAAAGILGAQQHPGGQPTTGGTYDPATAIQRRVDQLATVLSLTDSQKTQALKIFADAQTAVTALQTSITTNRTAIHTAVKANDIATIEKNSATIGTLTGQITSIQAKADAAFYSLLTIDQRTKYDQLYPGGSGGGGPRLNRVPGAWQR